MLKLGTFKEPDYLAIGPNCWGRAKKPSEAVRLAKANCPYRIDEIRKAAKKEPVKIFLYRLTDNTDSVEVTHNGSFFADSGEQPFLCAQLDWLMPNGYVLPNYTVPSYYVAPEPLGATENSETIAAD